jgi:hypothetical protein
MGGSITKLCERMRYWCEDANLGYDQGNRWDIRVGGESNCSSLTIFALREAGFDTGNASYTGDLSENLTARGWKRLPADISTCRPGDILLNDYCHVCVVISGQGWGAKIAQASIDENGRARGGKAGDQTGGETNIRGVYTYSKGWDCILRYGGADSGGSGSTATSDLLEVDGYLGPISVSRWQRQCGTPIDGCVSGQIKDCQRWFPNLTAVTFEGTGSELMRKVQEMAGVPNPSGIIARGSVCKIQGMLVLWGYDIADSEAGVIGVDTAKAIQQSLNDRRWKA